MGQPLAMGDGLVDKDSPLPGLMEWSEVDLLEAPQWAPGTVEPPLLKGKAFYSELPVHQLLPWDLYL